MRPSRSALLLLAVAAIACRSGRDAPATGDSAAATTTTAATGAADQGDIDLADVAAYRLSMAKVDQFLAAQKHIAVRMQAMSPAEREAMKARSANDDDESNNDDIGDIARKIESEPVVAAAVRDAGLTPREYAVLTMAMVQSSMAASVLKMRPNDNQDSLVREMKASRENVRFVIENEAELTRKQQALKAEMKRLGVDEVD